MTEKNKFPLLVVIEILIVLIFSMVWQYILDERFIQSVILLPFGRNRAVLSEMADSLIQHWEWDITILLLCGGLAAIVWFLKGSRAKIRTPEEVVRWHGKWWKYYGLGLALAVTLTSIFKLDIIYDFTALAGVTYFAIYDIIVFVSYFLGTLLISPIVVETAVLYGDRYHSRKGDVK